MNNILRKNLVLILTLAVVFGLLAAAAQGMQSKDFVITLLHALSVGSLAFLVAAGFSLIFGLLDVLNLAHGTLFMIGAYIGWTVVVRPDTFVDLLAPVALALSGLTLWEVYPHLSSRLTFDGKIRRFLPWVLILASLLLFGMILPRYPIAIWDVENYGQSPVTYAFMADQGTRQPVLPAAFTEISPALAFLGLLGASLIGALGLSMLLNPYPQPKRLTWKSFIGFFILLAIALLSLRYNDGLTAGLLNLNSNWLFLLAVVVAVLSGVGLGAAMESALIRPLYIRPIYQQHVPARWRRLEPGPVRAALARATCT